MEKKEDENVAKTGNVVVVPCNRGCDMIMIEELKYALIGLIDLIWYNIQHTMMYVRIMDHALVFLLSMMRIELCCKFKIMICSTHSATGTRTRVARVRAEYPNQLDCSGWMTKSNLLMGCGRGKRVNEPCANGTRERAHHEKNVPATAADRPALA